MSTSDVTAWQVGKVVGGIYEIRGVLSQGGMGLVYRGYDHATHRDIAVKVPLGRWEFDRTGARRLIRFVDSPQAKQDLVAEVRHWVALAHPHIVRAFDVWDDASTDYLPAIMMDYCDGGSLADRLYCGQLLSLATAGDVAIQVCWAMEYVHGQKLVHRDLKSQNVLLVKDGGGGVGKALVTDLGLAKALGARSLEPGGLARDAEEAALWVTVSAIGGTPTHMPPEQWQAGAHVGAASDVYAFGVLLYELFCRRLPFAGGQDLRQWKQAHQTAVAPDPRLWNSAIPLALAELMQQCLAKVPEARPRRFEELGGWLEKIYRALSGRDYRAVRVKLGASGLSAEAKRAQAWAKIRLGLGAYRRGDLEVALREVKEAAGVYRSLNDQGGLQASLGNQALILAAWGRLEEAMGLYQQEETICRQFGDRAGLSPNLGNQAEILQAWGRREEAMDLLKQEETICREFGDRAGLSRSLGNQALILAAWGRQEEAMGLHKQQEKICRELGDREGLARSLGNQALIVKDWGRLGEAMGLLKQDETICRELGNRAGLSRCLCNQALIVKDWGRLGEAMGLLKQDETICREIGDRAGLSKSLGNQALILKDWGRREEAMGLLKQQETICRELGNRAGLSWSLGKQALIMNDCSQWEQAMSLYKQEETICRELGERARLSANLAIQASILGLNLGRRKEALTKGEEALQLSTQTGLDQLTKQVQVILDAIRATGI